MANERTQAGNQTLESYIEPPEKLQSLYKRTLWIVMLSQIFGGAGLAAGITVGALLARDMLGTESYAGLPVFLFTLGSAGAALVVGRLSQRFGRRTGLAAGFLTGGIGSIGVVFAAIWGNVLLLFLALVIYGAGSATNLQARYAGTDLASTKQRGTAISVAMVATTFGAFAGPNLVGVMGSFAESIGVPALAGPFILAGAAYILAGIVLVALLRPDPLMVSRFISDQQKRDQAASGEEQVASPAVNSRGVFLGATVMVITQIVMVAIMTMTPVHMGHHGHSLNAIGMVIGIHVAAMYLPSLVTGMLVDKVGRVAMVVAAGVTLLSAGLVAAFASGDSLFVLILALALLGLGWNFGLISGTALIVDSTKPQARAKTQGTVDVLIALAGATGGGMSGLVVAGTSFAALSLAGGILSLLLVPVVIWFWRNQETSIS
ncbi:MFS transporter [Planococcus sp. CP5-4]|uniref:MFS transporter n=1 Tax=unclassified Planococcus (in: firmicutes) TaxID=2662419 RepID=UPI001C221A55|nr:MULTISPECIES: MFS transporter [unclassified Planococcus (in: firmicutes)]MBU9674567.1 MFS transporter [Planococcus sp. CP5-4_YE]MBV0910307.1 MFS transporter [Planococcus sp. CP5-4_UN]MBW6065158.1 MFS transporter [Planococcus sp. CP5-4]